jgi:hypothetical protein
VAYCTIEELAYDLGITVTAANTPKLQACVDAAAIEINDAIDWVPLVNPLEDPPNALLHRINVARGAEWWKASDTVGASVIGSEQTGLLTAPRSGFSVRYGTILTPLKQQWGIA